MNVLGRTNALQFFGSDGNAILFMRNYSTSFRRNRRIISSREYQLLHNGLLFFSVGVNLNY